METSSKPQKRGYIPPQNPEEVLLMRKVQELCKQVFFSGRVRSTDFLSDRQQQLAQAAANKESGCVCVWDGGYSQAERKVLTLLPEGQIYSRPFVCVNIQSISKSAVLQHRNCLGAVLGLGLERKSIGDIVLNANGCAVLFCLPVAADLIVQELTQIGKETVSASLCESVDAQQAQQQKELQKATVASLRVDAVLSAMLQCSREKAAKLIRAGKLEINHLAISSLHAEVFEEDVFTVRGMGRFRLVHILGKTRKDRTYIEYYQY